MTGQNYSDFLLKEAIRSGITDRKELANFMGQMEIESGGFVSMHENLNYSADRLYKVFHGRNGITSIEKAREIVKGGEEAIGNAVYGGEWGARKFGNSEPGDGWKYHGRGYVMLTGRELYAGMAQTLGVDFVNSPDLAADKSMAADIAVSYWQNRVVANSHQLDVREATHDINGGYSQLSERIAAAQQWETRLDLLFAGKIDPSMLSAMDWKEFAPDSEIDHAQRPIDLRDAAHPAHEYFEKTLDEVRMMEEGNGLPHGPHSEKIAAALLVGALRNGHGITNVAMEPDGQVRGYHKYSAFEPTRDVVVDPKAVQSVSMAQ